MKKTYCCVLIILSFTILVSCSGNKNNENERLIIVTLQSEVLNKDMISQVYLPKNYDADTRYPVLYFLPSNGGSSYTVINQFGITDCADNLISEDQIEPLIIVALGIDNSFGMDTGTEPEKVTTTTEKSFDKGMYETYIVNEAIPYIDEHFNTIPSKEKRYIGGYSMGGLAALHVAFRNPDLFSKVGGHSPTIFVEDFPDITVKEFMYPDESLRKERDPIYLAEFEDLADLQVYLDTGTTDENVFGLETLTQTLKKNDVTVELNFFEGTHGFAYCQQYMKEYLLFYGNTKY